MQAATVSDRGPGDSMGMGGASGGGEEDWRQKYPELAGEPPPEDGSAASASIDETMAVVKEKIWQVGDAALKGVAEVLYGFGISPTILGYTEEELMEYEDEVDIVDPYAPEVQDEVVAKTSFAMRSEDKLQRRKAEEAGPSAAVAAADAAEDGGVQFLPPEDNGWGMEEEEVVEYIEDKKDK